MAEGKRELPSSQFQEWVDIPEWQFATVSNEPFAKVGGPSKQRPARFYDGRGAELIAGKSVSLFPQSDSQEKRDGGPITDRFLTCVFEDKILVAVSSSCSPGPKATLAAETAVTAFSDSVCATIGRISNLKQAAFSLKKAFASVHHKLLELPQIEPQDPNPVLNCPTVQLLGGLIVKLKEGEEINWAFIGCGVGEIKGFRLSKHNVRCVTDATRGNRPIARNYQKNVHTGRLGPCWEDGSPDLRNMKLFLTAMEEDDVMLFTTTGLHSSFCPFENGLTPADLKLEAPSWDKLDERTGIRVLDEYLTKQLGEKVSELMQHLETRKGREAQTLSESKMVHQESQANFVLSAIRPNASQTAAQPVPQVHNLSSILYRLLKHSATQAREELSEDVQMQHKRERTRSWIDFATGVCVRASHSLDIFDSISGLPSNCSPLPPIHQDSLFHQPNPALVSNLHLEGINNVKATWRWRVFTQIANPTPSSSSSSSPSTSSPASPSSLSPSTVNSTSSPNRPSSPSRSTSGSLPRIRKAPLDLSGPLPTSSFDTWTILNQKHPLLAEKINKLTEETASEMFLNVNHAELEIKSVVATVAPQSAAANRLSPSGEGMRRSTMTSTPDKTKSLDIFVRTQTEDLTDQWQNLGSISLTTKLTKPQILSDLDRILFQCPSLDAPFIRQVLESFSNLNPLREIYQIKITRKSFPLSLVEPSFDALSGGLVVQQGTIEVVGESETTTGCFRFVQVESSKPKYLNEFIKLNLSPFLSEDWHSWSLSDLVSRSLVPQPQQP